MNRDGHGILRVVHSLPPIAVPALFAPVTLAFYWEIALPFRILADYDVWAYFYPLRAYAARAVQAGRFPLWNPETFLGSPFFANPQTSLLYPGSLLFFVLPIPYAYSLSVLAHVFLAAIFTYAFLRCSFGVQRIAAFFGASAFAFGGFVSAQVGHINQLNASPWLPAAVLCVDLAVRRQSLRWAAYGAGALGIQLLAGHAQESYMTLWAVGVILFWRALQGVAQQLKVRANQRAFMWGSWPAIGVGAAVVALGFGLAAVQLVSTAELTEHSIRGGGLSYLEATSFSLAPPALIRSLLPGYWYNPFGEYIGYVGGLGLGFAVLGALSGRPGPAACSAILAGLGLFFATGGANPFYRVLLDAIPGLDLFRVPARWLFVYSFGAAGLAALGVDWALGRARKEKAKPRAEAGEQRVRLSVFRLLVTALAIAGLLLIAIWFPPAVPGRIAALWVAALAAVPLLALLALRWPGRTVALAIGGLALVELRLAAMDLPQRYPVPSESFDGSRPVPTYLGRAQEPGRILSVAPTEYEVHDHAQIAARYPDLDPKTSFAYKSALKLDEVMSPNVPLRYGLSTVDGYDGGVLPLRRFLQIASLLVPEAELRSDGVLRTRLIAVPEERFLRFLKVRAIIAGQVRDVELAGMRFDVATARTLRDGQSIRVEVPELMDASSIGLLGSVAGSSPTSGTGRMALYRIDGSRDEVLLSPGQHLFAEMQPGPLSVPQPTAGLSRGARADSAVRIPIPNGSPVAAIEWVWQGSGAWDLRAATLIRGDGSQQQLLLQPDLRRTVFPDLKIYERPVAPLTRLVARAELRDDPSALAFLRSSSGATLDDVVVLATDSTRAGSPGAGGREGRTVDGQLPGPDLDSARPLFRRSDGTPERIVYQRVDGEGGGYLVADDAWFPGWRAEIDGESAPIYRANVYFKVVWVPPGAHTVIFTYEPSSLRVGGVISLMSLAVTSVLLIRGRIR